MRVLNIHGVNDVRLDPKAAPVAGDADVIVRIKACGICGSDLSYIKWGGIHRPEGGVTPIGHEAAGEVVAVGANVKDAFIGQRVAINPMNTPSNIGSGGTEGAFTDEVLVRDARVGDSLLPIADDVSFDIAALTEPLAVALHGVNRSQAKPGDKVVVFGCGPIGLAMVLWLVDRGVEDVIAVDLAPERLERALALGAKAVINAGTENLRERLFALHGHHHYFGREVADTDAYIDAAGGPNILSDVISFIRYQGRMVITAAYMKPVSIHLGAMLTTEMQLTTAVGYPTEMPEVVAALPRLQGKLAQLISHRFGFDDVLEGFAVAATPQSAKVMIRFGDAPA
ncbi:zinc-binding dehydrogenase [Acidocella sp.]|uniref:zinc-dependent alcohol dehydrogenase n=1 Tax=Acidocella sp. TaxID=50710 RepID=UPI002602CAD0|nr:alcohol dehydrogenase catalytic domain-containing protein [Acidocella sp.]